MLEDPWRRLAGSVPCPTWAGLSTESSGLAAHKRLFIGVVISGRQVTKSPQKKPGVRRTKTLRKAFSEVRGSRRPASKVLRPIQDPKETRFYGSTFPSMSGTYNIPPNKVIFVRTCARIHVGGCCVPRLTTEDWGCEVILGAKSGWGILGAPALDHYPEQFGSKRPLPGKRP
jgi:hypothetical protein